MNKCSLIETLALKMKLSVKSSEAIINTVIGSMTEALCKGERIEFRGFGTFYVKNYKPYLGRNPKTGQQVCVDSKKIPIFKVGKELKRRINI